MKNAKISITIPIDNVPKEIQSIMLRSLLRLSDIVDTLKKQNYSNLYILMQDIENVRKEITLADANLEDSYNILLGYLKTNIDEKVEHLQDNSNES